MSQVEVTGSRLEAELARVLTGAIHAWKASSSLAALKPVAVYDPNNVAVWLKAVAKSPVSKLRFFARLPSLLAYSAIGRILVFMVWKAIL